MGGGNPSPGGAGERPEGSRAGGSAPRGWAWAAAIAGLEGVEAPQVEEEAGLAADAVDATGPVPPVQPAQPKPPTAQAGPTRSTGPDVCRFCRGGECTGSCRD